MYRARKVYRERLAFFRDNVAAIIRIQTFWRAKKTKKEYKQLGQWVWLMGYGQWVWSVWDGDCVLLIIDTTCTCTFLFV